jgi:Fe-S cluster biogenesis protein NfuA
MGKRQTFEALRVEPPQPNTSCRRAPGSGGDSRPTNSSVEELYRHSPAAVEIGGNFALQECSAMQAAANHSMKGMCFGCYITAAGALRALFRKTETAPSREPILPDTQESTAKIHERGKYRAAFCRLIREKAHN